MDALLAEVANVGFPIAMAAYLIMKFESTINANTQAIQALKDTIRNCMVKK